MFRMRSYVMTCVAALLAVQLFAAPAAANSISVRSGGFVVVGGKAFKHHHRSKHKVKKYYAAPTVHHHKARPKVGHVKPVKRHHRSFRRHHGKRVSPYYVPKRYGIRLRGFSRYK
ncbi:hypothetical protein [Ruegeria sp.]|uniref:hypothetical protein n=1 Tax=Ruegeria sp. TaxID=1879320 RepID=UPI003B5A5536